MSYGAEVLAREDVVEGVTAVAVETTFPDGVEFVTVHDSITWTRGT